MSEMLSSGGLARGTSLLRSPAVGFAGAAADAPPKRAMSVVFEVVEVGRGAVGVLR